jgi:hypothetical protein
MSTYPLLIEPEELQSFLADENLLIIDQGKLATFFTAHVRCI